MVKEPAERRKRVQVSNTPHAGARGRRIQGCSILLLEDVAARAPCPKPQGGSEEAPDGRLLRKYRF